MASRPYLLHIQGALNDAHLNLTDAVAVRGDGWRDDELALLDRLDLAITHVVSMRVADKRDLPIRVRPHPQRQ